MARRPTAAVGAGSGPFATPAPIAPEVASLLDASVREKAALKSYDEFREATLQRFNAPLRELHRWSVLALIFVACSLVLLLAGGAAVIASALRSDPGMSGWQQALQALTSLCSLVIGGIAGLIFKQLRAIQRELNESRGSLSREFENATDRFFEDWLIRNPRKVIYATSDPDFHVGQFAKGAGRFWRDESIRQDQNYLYNYELVEHERGRLLLKATDAGRTGWVEINLETREIWWIFANKQDRQFLYRILQIV